MLQMRCRRPDLGAPTAPTRLHQRTRNEMAVRRSVESAHQRHNERECLLGGRPTCDINDTMKKCVFRVIVEEV